MKHTIRAFSLGLLTATVIIGYTYWDQSKDSEETGPTHNLTRTQMINSLENSGYHVLNSQEFSKTANASSAKKQQQQEDPIHYLSMDITSGTSSPEISKRLEKAEIISDAKGFEAFMKDKDYTRSIQVGWIQVNSDMSPKEIANTLIHKK
ncbi:hypothetical protein Q7A53_01690 [Halobacillus rhizosphaerae]|uniref:hypothetical protein n=1 Tax=Halobacillus rhizosphaerae TaxID=3064889 RepID=UPI00398B419D